jgi:hypothetical protein
MRWYRTGCLALLGAFTLSAAPPRSPIRAPRATAARSPKYYAMRAESAVRARHFASAIGFAQQLERIAPMNPFVAFFMARIYAHTGHSSRAIAELARAARMGFSQSPIGDSVLGTLQSTPGFTRARDALLANALPISSSQTAFALPDPMLMPEDITYDSADGSFYLGSLYEHKLVRVDSSRHVADLLNGDHGLYRVVGMKVDSRRRQLWFATWLPAQDTSLHGGAAVDRTQFGRFDLRAGRIALLLTPRDSTHSHTFNDVALAANGDVYISETDANAIYRVRADVDTLELFVQLDSTFNSPNGLAITPDGTMLYAGCDEGLITIDVATRHVAYLDGPHDIATSAMDGFSVYGRSLLGVQIEPGLTRVVQFDLDSSGVRIIGARTLERATRVLDDPTGGVVVGHTFYYIANAQWQLLQDDGRLSRVPTRTVIQRIDLTAASR